MCDKELHNLFNTIYRRKGGDCNQSYTARLLSGGTEYVARKFGEEAVETIIAAMQENKRAVITESADVLYHLFVLLVNADVSLEDVISEIEKRRDISGLEEKSSRIRG